MEQFIGLAKTVGADYVNFQKLTNWDTFCEEEYKQYDVCSPPTRSNVRGVADTLWSEDDAGLTVRLVS